MPTKLTISNVPDEDVEVIKAKAAEVGLSMEAWIRGRLHELAAAPVVAQRYVLRATSIQPRVAAIVIRRIEDDMSHDASHGMADEQQAAFETAVNYVKRNAAGDREAALGVLRGSFEHVIETLM